jgi:hypothetical protein
MDSIHKHWFADNAKAFLRGVLYCTFTTGSCNPLICNGAGEGNRTLVTGMVVYGGTDSQVLLDSSALVQ